MINTSPNNKQCDISSIRDFVQSKYYNLNGDVIEFGTFTGTSTRNLANQFRDKKI